MGVIYIYVHSFFKKSGVSLEIEKLVEADIEIKIDINFRHTFYFFYKLHVVNSYNVDM